MSIAFLLFILWLSLCGLVGLVTPARRDLARLFLMATAPFLLILTWLTQGWFPTLMVGVAVWTLFPAELARVVRLGQVAARGIAARRSMQDAAGETV